MYALKHAANRIAAAFAAAAFASGAGAATLAESHFDSTAESWSTIADATFQGWQTGGYIQAEDSGQGQNWYFSASTAFLGNKSTAGSLGFDLMATNATPYAAWDVVLVGNGITLATDLNPYPNPTGWTHFDVALDSAAPWRVIANGSHLSGMSASTAATAGQLLGVLGSLDNLYIRGEYHYGGGDIGKLDNVVLSSAVAPVPEPETYAMLLAGLGLLGFVARRRRIAVN